MGRTGAAAAAERTAFIVETVRSQVSCEVNADRSCGSGGPSGPRALPRSLAVAPLPRLHLYLLCSAFA